MHLNFPAIFPKLPKNPPAKIRLKRAMVITPDGETSRHADKGEEMSVSFDTLRQLEKSDYELMDAGRAPIEVSDPVPARAEARPLPEGWGRLPESFSTWWNLTEEFRTAREHVTAITAARVAFFGTDVRISDITFTHNDTGSGGIALIGSTLHANPRMGDSHGILSTVRPVNTSDEKLRKIDRLLTIGEDAAREFHARLIETKSLAYQKSFLACGQHRLKIADELREVLEGLADIGYQLFSVRTAALGLADFQRRRLYTGSADFERFGNFAPAICHGVSSAGLDREGQMITYSDQPVPTQATWSLNSADRLTELKPLLEQGRRELAKARKASAA